MALAIVLWSASWTAATAAEFPVVAAVEHDVAQAGRYVAISPTRVHDSRHDDLAPSAGGVFTVSPLRHDVIEALDGDVDVADVTAVVVNVTALDAAGPGYVTVYPSGTVRPTTSTVNYESPTQIIANLATSRVGRDGRLSVFTLTTVDVIVDVQGVFVRASSARAGRHEPIAPRRVLDTRLDHRLVADAPRSIDVSQIGVPVDATAALISIAAVDTTRAGYFTVWPADHDRPTASNLNFSAAGATVSNGAVVSLHDGRFTLVSSADADAVIDVSGYVTGEKAPDSRAGLFVPVDPQRVVDTRRDRMIYARSTTAFRMAGEGPIPAEGVASVAVNITVTEMERPGYVAALASGRTFGFDVSTVNVGDGIVTASSAAVVRIGAAGSGVGLYTSSDTHAIVDVSGYFLGEPDRESSNEFLSPPVPPRPPVNHDYALLHQGRELPAGFSGHVVSNGRRFIGWHPCRPIRYIVHDRHASRDDLDVLDAAVSKVAAATGFEFVNVGRAAELISPEPSDLGVFAQPIDAELLIGFSHPAETPKLAGSTKGFGGIGFHGRSYRIEGATVYHRDGGMVAVDIAELTSRDHLMSVLLHELAHFVGLAHSPDGRGQVMSRDVAPSPQTEFGDGDLNGLRLLGTVGCTR